MISILLCAGLAIIAMISIIKIIRIHVAESEREQKILNLKESYVSDHTDEEPGTTEAVSIEEADAQESSNAPVSDASEAEDDPDAWYHDIEVDMESLSEQNPDIIGWIYFENEETISYPILYSGDDYYLRRDYLGNDDIAGSIYVEGVNHPDLSDAHTHILTLSTCSYDGNIRFTVSAVRIDEYRRRY